MIFFGAFTNEFPLKGEITLFNRSHYEDVLIVKVHGWADINEIDRTL